MSINVLSWIQSLYLKDFLPTNTWVKERLHKHMIMPGRLGLTLLEMNTKISVDSKDYSVITLRCSRLNNDRENTSIYCFLYLNSDSVIEYICYSPSLTSMDGEYRRRFIPYNQFEIVYSTYSDVFNFIEEMVRPLIDNNKILLTAQYSDAIFHTISGIEDYLANSRIPLQCYIVSWFCYMFPYDKNLIENHINKRFFDNVFDKRSKLYYTQLLEKFGIHKLENILWQLTNILPNPNKPSCSSLECGQKLIPLNVRELQSMGDVRHAVWKEIYCNRILGDLIVNNVYSGISLFGGWFLFNINRQLFDNDSMYNKIHQSDKIRAAINKLKSIKDEVTLHETLAQAFDNPVEIAENNIIQSDQGICIISEYVGRTFADMPKMTYLSYYKQWAGSMFEEPALFHRYTFDIIYGLFCCNSIMGIMHGDLHLNNCTIYPISQLYNLDGTLKSAFKNPHIVYNWDDKNYILPHRGAYACLIDFSRAVLEPTCEILQSMGIDMLRDAVLQTYSRYFPDFYKEHKRDLEIVTLQSPREVYRLFTAFDTYSFSNKLTSMMNSADIIIPETIREFIKNIENKSKSYLIDDMLNLVSTHRELSSIPYPNKEILEEFYSMYELNNYHPDDVEIVDAYKWNDKLKYSTLDIKKWPPYLQEVKTLDCKCDKNGTEHCKTKLLVSKQKIQKKYVDDQKRHASFTNKVETVTAKEVYLPPREPLIMSTE